jgi:hypothetical protein
MEIEGQSPTLAIGVKRRCVFARVHERGVCLLGPNLAGFLSVYEPRIRQSVIY